MPTNQVSTPLEWPSPRRLLRFAGVGLACGIALSVLLIYQGDPAADRTFTTLSPTGTAPLWANVGALLGLGVCVGVALAVLVPLYGVRHGRYLVGPLAAVIGAVPVALVIRVSGIDVGFTREYHSWQISLIAACVTVLLSAVGALARPFAPGEASGAREGSRPAT